MADTIQDTRPTADLAAVDDAIDAAIAVLHKHLGVTTGDYAAQWFEGAEGETIREWLLDYVAAERSQGAQS